MGIERMTGNNKAPRDGGVLGYSSFILHPSYFFPSSPLTLLQI
jgi:hypothetical protein